MYTLNNSQEHDNLPNFFSCIIQVFDITLYVLRDPGASLSFVTPYVSINFDIILEQHSKPSSVSAQVYESILIEKSIYRDCSISVN